jgi:predicted regulator of Ras-like GTPase activity (Roadblock/LC7/MglB family)
VPFKKILQDFMEAVPSASGAILADWEGESVEQCCSYDEFDLKIIGAHKGILLNFMKELHHELNAGELETAVISTDGQHILIGPVGPDYIMVATLRRDVIVGLAVQHFREAVARFYKEIY